MSDHGVAERTPAFAFVRTMLVGFSTDHQARLERLLRRHGHDVSVVPAERAEQHAAGIDLILVEVDDRTDSLEICERVATWGTPAVIAVSARDTDQERLRILQAGCDDHLCHEYGPVEIMARIDAVLRWVANSGVESPVVEYGPLRLDTGNRQVRVEGTVVHLTRKEYDLLHLLVSRSGTVVDRTEIMDTVWHQHSAVANRTLDTHVSSLRRKIGRWACVTVKGYGLRIGLPGDGPDIG